MRRKLMRISLAAGALVAALALNLFSQDVLAQSKPPPKPAATTKAQSAKPVGQKALAKPSNAKAAKNQPPKPTAKKGGKKVATRKSNEPSQPDEATRRAIAGISAQKNVRESAELSQMRAIDLALFPAKTPDAGEPWQVQGSPIATDKDTVVISSGLPPAGQLAVIAPPAPAKDLSWLKQLEMPDIPVRWDARVIRYLEFYKNDPRGRSLATIFIKKSGRYGAAIRTALREQKIPEDILWLSLVESGFDPTIHSPAGAAGLWQFMPEGARIYGLNVDRWVDERHDPERATLAAARYLSDLKTRFGTWELAFAAYNMGYGGLLTAIKKYNTNDFWELSKLEAGVPLETALYVPKIISIAIVARNKAAFGLDSVELDPAITFDKVAVESGVSVQSVASAAGVSSEVIENLNPQILAGRAPPLAPGVTVDTKWPLRVPEGAGQKTSKNLPKWIGAEPKLLRYTVRFGESVEDIAAAQKTSKGALNQLNGIRLGESVRPGTVILVPAKAFTGAAVFASNVAESPNASKPVVVVPAQSFAAKGKRRVFYRVVSGDTLPEVAAALGTTVDDLGRFNLFDSDARLHDGMTLQAYLGENQVVSSAVILEERDARILAVGSNEFFTYFESRKGRERTFVAVKEGDTFAGIAKKHGLSVGMLERINQRSRSGPLTPGEKLVVYVPAGRTVTTNNKEDEKTEVVMTGTANPAPTSNAKTPVANTLELPSALEPAAKLPETPSPPSPFEPNPAADPSKTNP